MGKKRGAEMFTKPQSESALVRETVPKLEREREREREKDSERNHC